MQSEQKALGQGKYPTHRCARNEQEDISCVHQEPVTKHAWSPSQSDNCRIYFIYNTRMHICPFSSGWEHASVTFTLQQ